MLDVLQHAETILRDGRWGVLGTVVRLDGSGYAGPGTRMVMDSDGGYTGYISGGCLEKELCRRAVAGTVQGPATIAFDTRGRAMEATRINTGCEGVVWVYCERFGPDNDEAVRWLRDSQSASDERIALTVYRSESAALPIGSRWQRIGSRWRKVAAEDGRPGRTTRLEGGPLANLIAAAETIDTFTRSCSAVLIEDGQERSVEYFVERLRPTRRLIVFGGGDDAMPVVAGAVRMGWAVVVVDANPHRLTTQRFGGATLIAGRTADAVANLSTNVRTDVVVMTHDFEGDIDLLPALSCLPVRSIGWLGPKRRLGRLIHHCYQRGVTIDPAMVHRMRCPIGLDIGSESPQEVALSILAELVAIENGRGGGRLHDHRGALHDRPPHRHESLVDDGSMIDNTPMGSAG